MKRLLILATLALFAVLAINTLRLRPPPHPAVSAPLAAVDENAAAQRLAGAVRIPTISFADRAQDDPKQLEAFAAYLQASFPRLHAQLTREVVNSHSLLYTWIGKDPKAYPILLLAHQDVVPVEPGTESRWTHPPFSGDIAEGYVWGRGALDDKGSLVALCEAAELLLAQNFQPARTIYFAFGHDEEVGGQQGAKQVSALLKLRGVHAEFSLDEGGAITQGIVPGVAAPIASIMAAEKGYASFRLTARDEGGHSSRPPKQTAIGRLARAVARVQDHPMPARLAPPTTDMLDRVAPEMPFMQRLGIANRWLLAPLVKRALAANPTTDALIRTTTAPTMFHAGIKDNVLPSEAHAVINFRLLPGDSVQDVEDHIRKTVDDEGIAISPYGEFNNDASPVAETHSNAFALIERTVNEVFPEAVVTTGLVLGATDNRNYAGLYDNRYNFSPSRFQPGDLARVHGTDERIGVKDYARIIQFYVRLLQNAAQ